MIENRKRNIKRRKQNYRYIDEIKEEIEKEVK